MTHSTDLLGRGVKVLVNNRRHTGETDALALHDGRAGYVVHALKSKALQPYPSANDSFARFLQELAKPAPETAP